MKTNSTATITMKYVIHYPRNGTIDTTIGIYDAGLQKPEPLTLNDLTIKAAPRSINLTGNNTVTYTIVAKNNIKGVYTIAPISSCGKSPLVVGLNESDVLPATLFRFSMPVNCPVISNDAPILETTNYDRIISKTVTMSQDRFSPIEQIQLGSNTTDVKCKQGLELVIKSLDNMPGCVMPEHVSRLVKQGWSSYHETGIRDTGITSENPLSELLLKFTNQTQANLIFYDMMNEQQIRNWSQTGWKYNFYDSTSDGDKQTASATVHLYLPANEKNHPECKNGSQALVVVNLKPKPIEIESNMTELGCIPDSTGGGDPELNRK